MIDVTSKGIWSAGLVALGALAAFCVWHHAPIATPVTPNLQTSQAASASAQSTTPKAALPPTVTGPTSNATPRMPTGEPVPAATPKIEIPVVSPPKVEAPKIELPISEAPKADVPKVEAAAVAPAIVAPAPMVKSTRSTVKTPKKRMMVAKRSNAGCELKGNVSVVRSICFSFNSDRLTAASKAKLNAIVPTLQTGKQVELNGFADAVGNKAYNNNLSERRNNAVLKYLTSKGVDANKVATKSFGSEEAEKAGKSQRDRRVDVRVVP
jgi:outer membrane protein OmpA-like peptidoglycan-associated protein